jgi:hypothetical protein
MGGMWTSGRHGASSEFRASPNTNERASVASARRQSWRAMHPGYKEQVLAGRRWLDVVDHHGIDSDFVAENPPEVRRHSGWQGRDASAIKMVIGHEADHYVVERILFELELAHSHGRQH